MFCVAVGEREPDNPPTRIIASISPVTGRPITSPGGGAAFLASSWFTAETARGERKTMGQAIGDIFLPAIGVAASPSPIIAVILILFTPMPRSNGPAFMTGWIAGVAASTGLILLLASPDGISGDGDDPATWASLLQLALGLGLLYLALKEWKRRPKEGEVVEMPKWMASVETATPPKAIGLGAFLSGLNPKILLFNAAAAIAIAQADLPRGEALVPFLLYVLLASLSVIVPVIWYLLAQEHAAKTLAGWKAWLTVNNALVMAILLLVLGINFAGKGLGGIVG
jgi:threonine/homoserine/homoserine lactone efflux protein